MGLMNDVVADNVGAGEEMVLDGLAGADAVESLNGRGENPYVDSVDAGGQRPVNEGVITESYVMDDSGPTETEEEVLVEPGQSDGGPPAPPVARRPSPMVKASNGAHQNGVHRNGAGGSITITAGKNTGIVPRNRMTAFDNAAPLIQGMGPATARSAATSSTGKVLNRGAIEMAPSQGPPNPASFGLGQTPLQNVTSAIDIATKTANALIPAAAGVTLPAQAQTQQVQQSESGGTPWALIGLVALGLVGTGAAIYHFKKSKPAPQSPARSNPSECPECGCESRRNARSAAHFSGCKLARKKSKAKNKKGR